MAEAEDVITDAARHATVFARQLWRRHRPAAPGPLALADVAQRIDLLLSAVFGRSFALRVAQPPLPPSWLARWLFPNRLPPAREAIPATDGHSLWLPRQFDSGEDAALALQRFRTLALQQAMRAQRGSAAQLGACRNAWQRELYALLEARAADDALVRLLPGLTPALLELRRRALQRRPPLASFPKALHKAEALVRGVLEAAISAPPSGLGWPGDWAATLALPASSTEVLAQSQALAESLQAPFGMVDAAPPALIWRDAWLGELRPAADDRVERVDPPTASDADAHADAPPPSARLARRPEVRPEQPDEDDAQPGAWMVQTAQPHEQAGDPMGLQRPTDRDASTAAEDFADALSELPEARLVYAPAKPKEVLISDDPPPSKARAAGAASQGQDGQLSYPEWDWRAQTYRVPGATVLLRPAAPGPQQWVDDTLAQRRAMLHDIRRRFELLRARRTRVHRQLDGDDIDLAAYIEGQADFRAGLPLSQRVYQREHHSRRDMAIVLLVDVSGSTDSWVAADRRVIDVEREALLLVCLALEGLREPYSVLAFSGEGPSAVTVRPVKAFDEHYGNAVAQRIAGLQPERYTRAGAALRHASSVLMAEPAHHRLLLLLSDGKPNDIDDYEGRYGVEDMRQAVTESRLQGISPFCLTIDRQAASYLPAVFGPRQYALLTRPDRLPTVLLDWLRRLVGA